jgi:hypothetical protein
LTPNEELGVEIKRWIIMRSTNTAGGAARPDRTETAPSGGPGDDLYDF